MTKTRKIATRGVPQGALAATWRGPHPGRAGRAPRPLGPLPVPPSGLYNAHHPKTLKRGEFTEFRRRSVAETYREEKPSRAGRFRRGDHLPEGEIITIVTGIIGIIINIIPIISTISTSIQSHLTIATRVVIRTIYPLYSIDVDYYFVVNAIEFCWRNIIVSRLFIIYLSPLIMISFMSCE